MSTIESDELRKVLKKENSYFFHSNGDGTSYFEPPSEFDPSLNQVTLDKIYAFAKQYGGRCWLGAVNLYSTDPPDKPILKEYICEDTGVYNFEYSFIIPQYDETLKQMIIDRANTPYTGTKDDSVLVEAIHNRVDELGGMYLHWV